VHEKKKKKKWKIRGRPTPPEKSRGNNQDGLGTKKNESGAFEEGEEAKEPTKGRVDLEEEGRNKSGVRRNSGAVRRKQGRKNEKKPGINGEKKKKQGEVWAVKTGRNGQEEMKNHAAPTTSEGSFKKRGEGGGDVKEARTKAGESKGGVWPEVRGGSIQKKKKSSGKGIWRGQRRFKARNSLKRILLKFVRKKPLKRGGRTRKRDPRKMHGKGSGQGG